MKKLVLCLCLCVFLAMATYGEKLSLRINFGGTYLLGGDYNKGIEGLREYELSSLGTDETFIDNMKKLGLGYQLGAELFYQFSPSLAVGLEAGYLSASVTSQLERPYHGSKWTANPTLSAVPVTLNLNFFKPLGKKMKLHAMVGAGAFISDLKYKYFGGVRRYGHSGTWTPDTKIVFGAKAGVGLEYPLANKLALTLDVSGRYAELKGITGPWKGFYLGVPESGTGTLYIFDFYGYYPYIGIYEIEPFGVDIQNLRKAKLSLSGVSLLIGIKINL